MMTGLLNPIKQSGLRITDRALTGSSKFVGGEVGNLY